MMQTYDEALTYIHSRPKKHRTASLANMHQILTYLGEPQKNFQSIHITGTNGKGSVSYLLSAMIQNTGVKIGTFLSPFIRRFNERIQIDLEPISDDELVYWTNQVALGVQTIKKKQPEFELAEFETVTAIMFAYFAAHKVDVAVIEVGIGGAHDKTNVIDPLFSIITTIGADHLQLIGPTLADVAIEKAGVIKPGRPVILGRLSSELAAIVTAKAQAQNSPVYRFDHEFKATQVHLLPDYRQTFDLTLPNRRFKNLTIKSIAAFEVDNAAVAVMAYILFCKLTGQLQTQDTFKPVLAKTDLIGRTELISESPFILLDGAHNPPAFKSLLDSLTRAFPQTEIHLIAAFMKDKAIAEVLPLLRRQSGLNLYLTQLDMPRSATKADLEPLMHAKDQFYTHWQQAFLAAYQNASAEDLIVITGSIYLVSAARHELLEDGKEDV
ncbi:bifunctional folylpolyglutamate synthase/dihydrofolate synthase [Agrilactobacillus fermenti]|uniref:bifunctional folylpolyglutamate synthase/dihydrofolate synthase n=1 Tax=Agrilactobacillus fermenti TaxID=2586909 RepID=UPI001E2F5F93|nr:folylpolyglutamate synthase/dihydrofolate synthase family protein [Agrilactobacillus fermenti]MCD2256479.1 bifunctional folylpolyglutamate synthase/dihydrofolate synthase [Agrilactobacillus fermenti]